MKTKRSSVAAGPSALAMIWVATACAALPAHAQTSPTEDAAGATAPTAAPDLFAEPTVDGDTPAAEATEAIEATEATEPVPMIPVVELAAPAPADAIPKSEAPTQIEEIVVTATKRAQSLRDIPQSINAISGEKLEAQGKLNLIDFIQETPGVTASQGNSGYTRFTMRGISTDTAPTSPTSSPVGVFIGDTAFTDPYIANIVPDLSAFDLAGIQVLKGPQGTLFGGAALSGAIRYELQEPVIGEWQARGFTQWIKPTDGEQAFTSGVALNLPLNDDSLALRLAYVRRNYPGVLDDARTGEEDVDHGSGNQYRALLLWQPDAWTFKLTHLSQDFFAPNAIYTANSPHGPREVDTNIYETPARNKFGMDSLEIDYDFGSTRLVSLSSYLFKDSVFTIDTTPVLLGTPVPGYPTALGLFAPCTENSTAFSQEVRWQSTGSDPFQWIVGGYYYSYNMYFNLLIDTPLNQGLIGPDSPLYRLISLLGIAPELIGDNTTFFEGTSDVTSTEKALFLDLSYNLWDRLDLSAGARLYETKVAGGFIGTGILLRAENNGLNSDTTDELTERGVNPKLTATWHFSPTKSLYAQVAKGFRFGGIQYVPSTPTNGVPSTYKSDTLWNHELGLRTSWLDRTLNADLTAFYIRYKDPIITQATPGIPINYNDNVSAAVSSGVEASLFWLTPVDGLSLSLRGAWTDAHITTPFKSSSGDQIESGQQMPGTAPEQYNASIQYLRPVGLFNVGLSTGYNYVGQGYNDLQHSVEINGYGTFDAGVVLTSDAWSFRPTLAFNVSNILDEISPNAGGIVTPLVPLLPAVPVYALIPPRTFSVRLSFDF